MDYSVLYELEFSCNKELMCWTCPWSTDFKQKWMLGEDLENFLTFVRVQCSLALCLDSPMDGWLMLFKAFWFWKCETTVCINLKKASDMIGRVRLHLLIIKQERLSRWFWSLSKTRLITVVRFYKSWAFKAPRDWITLSMVLRKSG